MWPYQILETILHIRNILSLLWLWNSTLNKCRDGKRENPGDQHFYPLMVPKNIFQRIAKPIQSQKWSNLQTLPPQMNARNWPNYVTEKCLFIYFWCCLYPCTVLCCEPPTLWEKKPKVWTQDYSRAEDSVHKVVMKGFTSLGIISQNLFKVIKFWQK